MDYYIHNFQQLSNEEFLSSRNFTDKCALLGFPYLSTQLKSLYSILSSNTPDKGISLQSYSSFLQLATSGCPDPQIEIVFKFMSDASPGISYENFSLNIRSLQRLYNKHIGSKVLMKDSECKNSYKEFNKSGAESVDFNTFTELWNEKNPIVEWNKFIIFGVFEGNIRVKNSLGCKLDAIMSLLSAMESNAKPEYFHQISPYELFIVEELPSFGNLLTWEQTKNAILSEASIDSQDLAEIFKSNLAKLKEAEVFCHSPEEHPRLLSTTSTWFLISGISQLLRSDSLDTPQVQKTVKINNIIHTFRVISHCRKAFNATFSSNPSFYEDLLRSYSILPIILNSLSQDFSVDPWQETSGKSSSYFFSLPCAKFLLKSYTDFDIEFINTFAEAYSEYLVDNPETLLCRICGWFTFKEYKGLRRTKAHFLIMNDLLRGFGDNDLVFDLKGSIVGRENKEKCSKMNPLKDNEFIKMGMKLNVKDSDKVKIIEQLRRDFEFLEKLNVTDYSLIVGIKDAEGANEENEHFRVLSACGKYFYSFGVIDFFSTFNIKKQIELMFKSSFYGPGVSCMPPKEYRIRLIKFVEGIFQ